MISNPNNFYVIPQLRLKEGRLMCRPTGKRALRKVHFQQGSLDGACGVYSFLMALGILGIFEPGKITSDTLGDLSVAEKRLVRELNEHGLYRKGLRGKKIKSILEETYRSKLSVEYLRNDSEDFLQSIVDALDGGEPVIVGIANDKLELYHWVLAVGYQYWDDSDVHSLLILDPGYPTPVLSYWNGILSASDDGEEFLYLSPDSVGNYPAVILDDAVFIKRKQKK